MLGLNPEEIIRGIASFQNTGRRQRLCTVQGRRIIDDCYNAAPDSIAAALTVLDQMAGGKKVAALGCMLELGDAAPEAHRAVGAQTAKSCQMLLCYGPWAGDYVQGAIAAGMDPAQALAFDNHPALTEALLRQTEPGDVILLKGSRGMHMEEVLRLLEEEDGGTGK